MLNIYKYLKSHRKYYLFYEIGDSIKLSIKYFKLFNEYLIRKILKKSLRKFDIIFFEHRINKKTKKIFNKTYFYAKSIMESESDNLLIDSRAVNKTVIKNFNNKYSNLNTIFYLHLPNYKRAVGSYSAFYNLGIALKHIGFQCQYFSDISDLKSLDIDSTKNNLVLTLDEIKYLGCSAKSIKSHLQRNIKVGVYLDAASLNSKQNNFLRNFEKKDIDFFFTFSTDEYNEYKFKSFLEVGAGPVSIEFGANPFIHYPIENDKYLDYIFLGSTNRSKIDRYIQYFNHIFQTYKGFLYGPGWLKYFRKNKSLNLDSILYSYCKIGLNLSVDVQLEYPRELNERTYQLAACGIPQLIDNPLLLFKRFPSNSVFSASTPLEYTELFDALIHNEIKDNVVTEYVNNAYKITMDKYTIFHRAEKLLHFLKSRQLI